MKKKEKNKMKLQIKKPPSLNNSYPSNTKVKSEEKIKKQDSKKSIKDSAQNIHLFQPESLFSNLTVDSLEFKKLPILNLKKAEVIDGELKFETPCNFDQALQDGLFLVRIPPNLDVVSGDQFSHNFYKPKNGYLNDNYRGFQHVLFDQSYQGYFDRKEDQAESLYIEESNWKSFLPSELQTLGYQMIVLGINILKSILKKVEVHEQDWDQVTGDVVTHKGHQMLTFNHFRPEKDTRGMKLHTDSGWVTLLRSTKPGLVAVIDNKLFSVNPEKSFFIVNFGRTLEILTEKLKIPLKAQKHGVVKIRKQSDQNPDRISYTLFLDSNLKSNVYKYENKKAVFYKTMDEFIEELHKDA